MTNLPIPKSSNFQAKRSFKSRQLGASLVEFIYIAPILLMMTLGTIQIGLVFHAKSNLNYAAFEAARAGSVSHGSPNAMKIAFIRAMTGYYGGGTTNAELAASYAKAMADVAPNLQIEVIAPTKESFDDYASPKLQAKLQVNTRVIPNTNIAYLQCPIDQSGCNHDPATNKSGQTLQDANLLKIKITYGIPSSKQVPLVGFFYHQFLSNLKTAPTDPFQIALVAQSRIPIVAHVTLRMQSEPFENGNASIPGGVLPTPPATPPTPTPNPNPPGDDYTPPTLPPKDCDPVTDPDKCKLNGGLPIGCKSGDGDCDPTCDSGLVCCTASTPPPTIYTPTPKPGSSGGGGFGVFTSKN